MAQQKTLYLKYRPRQLVELVGQRQVKATLKQSSLNNKFAHSYLFSGERGCGKTSTARIVAMLMTCENVSEGKVCGKCRACTTISKGASLDVKELNGATSRGIDEAKALIDSAYWSPQEFKRKIYIIDECHMLTKEANSALLKILEEPPEYLTFILCTTELKKILSTIKSRCQRFNFTKIPSTSIAERLLLIAEKENINIDEDAVSMLAKMARGSMRDAIGYIDQLATVASDKELTEKHVMEYFGVVGKLGIMSIVKEIKSGNVSKVLDQVNDMIMASADAKNIMFDISEVFRNIMILKASDNHKSVDLPEGEIKELEKIGESLDLNKLMKLAHLFSNIEKKLEFNINERWIMEATLIKCIADLRS